MYVQTYIPQGITARVSSKQRSVSVVFRFVSWNQKQKNLVCLGLFGCFEPLSKQPKQTELFHTKLKQTETTQHFLKNTKICSLSNCFVGLLFVSLQSKHWNSLFRYSSETTETNCFETNCFETNKNNPKFSEKNTKICSLSNCFGCSSVCFGSIETTKPSVFGIKAKQLKQTFCFG